MRLVLSMNRAFIYLLLLLLIFSTDVSRSAQFFYEHDDENPHLKMIGKIEIGDSEKFLKVILNIYRKDGIESIPRRFVIGSGGGSVAEAIKIAALIEKFRLSTSVDGRDHQSSKEHGICASACFLVWLGGYFRYASGFYVPNGDELEDGAFGTLSNSGLVGLHRPYLDLAESSSKNIAEVQLQQRQEITGLRRYLEERSVSSDLIEKMMAHTSKNIYWLRPKEVNRLGESPEYEELLVANCNYRKTIVSDQSSDEEVRMFLKEASGEEQERVSKCSRALIQRLRSKELPNLMLRLNKGWRPWIINNK